MAFIATISGIRGTIGGMPGDNLTPIEIVKYSAAYAEVIRLKYEKGSSLRIVVGRDARVSGEMVNHLVCGTLLSLGIDVIDVGLSTTPTVEVAVPVLNANGGIILTASHNPGEWNALKLLNEKGEFFSEEDAKMVIELAAKADFVFSKAAHLGTYTRSHGWIDKHIQMVLDLPLVDVDIITRRGFKIVVDAVNSTGGIAIPALLKALGVEVIYELNCNANGLFAHNPEPLPEHLTELSELVRKKKADLGFVVDPDVDRLAIVDEKGNMFGEEYTLVAVADYVLKHKKGNTVSNLSSSRALADVTKQHGQQYFASAVGEVNVVRMMKEQQAAIGGEGNGGIIYPELHYGRDALVGIALFLTHLAASELQCSELRATYPAYFISKNKIPLPGNIQSEEIFRKVIDHYKNERISTIDGVKIDFEQGWVHLRKSNTERIIRIYAEGKSPQLADELAMKMKEKVQGIISSH